MFQWVSFGKVKYDNTIFNQDVLVSTTGDVYERQTDDPMHVTAEELKASLDADTKIVVVGTGHYGIVKIDPEAKAYLKERKIELIAKETTKAVDAYNKKMSGRGKKPKITAIINVS